MDAFRLSGEQAGQGAVAGAEVGDTDPRRQEEEHLADGLPGAARTVVPAEPIGDEVEVLLGLLASFLDDPLERPLVRRELGLLGAGGQGRLDDRGHAGGQVAGRRVEGFLAVATVVGQAGLA